MQFALAFNFFLKRKLYPVDVHIVLKEYLVTLTAVSLKRPTVLAASLENEKKLMQYRFRGLYVIAISPGHCLDQL